MPLIYGHLVAFEGMNRCTYICAGIDSESKLCVCIEHFY